MSFLFTVYYKGYFVPLPDDPAVDCATTTKAAGGGGAATTAKPAAAQSWDTPARIQSSNAVSPVNTGVQPQKTPSEVEVFVSTPAPALTKAPQNSVEDLGEKPAPNINIEIHNIFSFGAENASNLAKNGTREV